MRVFFQHSCEGDDGGPMACEGKLTGIVSRVCGDPLNEGVYTRVEHYIDWIEANARPDDPETTTVTKDQLTKVLLNKDQLNKDQLNLPQLKVEDHWGLTLVLY